MPIGTPLVVYHANCADGFCAALVARRRMPGAEFVPAHYGDDPPPGAEDKDRPLYVLDFSYPRDVLFRLAALRHEEVIVLDHHKTARTALDGLEIELAANNCGDALTVRFDEGKSGAALAWEHFFPRAEAPWLVRYVEARDLWRFDLPGSREVSAALASYPFDFDVWEDLSRRRPEELAGEGVAILRYQGRLVAGAVAHAGREEIGGYIVPVVNATCLISETAGELAKGQPFAACWFEKADGKRVYSLRSEEGGVDVAEIARQYGGGGHKHAAGFTR